MKLKTAGGCGFKASAQVRSAQLAHVVGKQAARGRSNKGGHSQYLKLADRLPGILKFVPTAGALTDVKHYLYLFCYFLQPTPANIRIDVALRAQGLCSRRKAKSKVRIPQPEHVPSSSHLSSVGSEVI